MNVLKSNNHSKAERYKDTALRYFKLFISILFLFTSIVNLSSEENYDDIYFSDEIIVNESIDDIPIIDQTLIVNVGGKVDINASEKIFSADWNSLPDESMLINLNGSLYVEIHPVDFLYLHSDIYINVNTMNIADELNPQFESIWLKHSYSDLSSLTIGLQSASWGINRYWNSANLFNLSNNEFSTNEALIARYFYSHMNYNVIVYSVFPFMSDSIQDVVLLPFFTFLLNNVEIGFGGSFAYYRKPIIASSLSLAMPGILFFLNSRVSFSQEWPMLNGSSEIVNDVNTVWPVINTGFEWENDILYFNLEYRFIPLASSADFYDDYISHVQNGDIDFNSLYQLSRHSLYTSINLSSLFKNKISFIVSNVVNLEDLSGIFKGSFSFELFESYRFGISGKMIYGDGEYIINPAVSLNNRWELVFQCSLLRFQFGN